MMLISHILHLFNSVIKHILLDDHKLNTCYTIMRHKLQEYKDNITLEVNVYRVHVRTTMVMLDRYFVIIVMFASEHHGNTRSNINWRSFRACSVYIFKQTTSLWSI